MNIKEELKTASWVEKYRPQHVKDVISDHKNKVLKYLENPKQTPNFLFYSRTGGTGKSSLGKAIINDMGCDSLFLNASADRSIDMIRDKVKTFLLGQSTNGVKRCVMMDEGEKLSRDAMDALKNMIEEYQNNSFFIFTTNNINKINQPMQSRFVRYEFSLPDKEEIKKHLMNICANEDLVYDIEGLNKLINIYYPSIRNMISVMQDLFVQNKPVKKEFVDNPDDKYVELFSLIKNKDYRGLKKVIIEDDVDVVLFNKFIFDYLIKNDIGLKKEFGVIQCCARNVKAFNMGADPLIVFLSESINMMKVFNEVQ